MLSGQVGEHTVDQTRSQEGMALVGVLLTLTPSLFLKIGTRFGHSVLFFFLSTIHLNYKSSIGQTSRFSEKLLTLDSSYLLLL